MTQRLLNQQKGARGDYACTIEPQASFGLAVRLETACVATVNAPGDDRETLVTGAVQGDPAAIDGVLRWICPLALRYCRSRGGGLERTVISADDVAQEVCLAVLRALPTYRDQGRPFLAFVYGIAAHKVADAHRTAARNRAKPVPDVPDSTDLADGPESQVINGEFAGLIARLLGSVSDKQREILYLRAMVGLSVEETAEAVGSTPGAVRVAQHRALNRLRALLTVTSSGGAKTKAMTSTSNTGHTFFTEWMEDGRAVW